MQRFILGKKNQIALINAVLIAIAFAGKLLADKPGFGHAGISHWVLMAASILGVLPIAIQAYQALRVKVVSIDVLVTMAVVGAFLIKNFEESAIVTFLFLFGDFLEKRTLEKTRSAIKELTEMAPESALKKMANGEFAEVPVDEVDIGDILLVKTGAKVPVDGRVISGEGSVNEAAITGESLPVRKEKGSRVFAGTVLDNGTIQIVAERVGEDTTFGKIIELVEEAQNSKSKAERFIDRFSKYYTPAVLILGIVAWLISRNIELAITILVLGCPGALVIGVPVSNVAGIGNGARNGILLKGSEVISDFSRVDTVVFDKTGTLTVGNPSVAEVEYYGDNAGDTGEGLGDNKTPSVDEVPGIEETLTVGETQGIDETPAVGEAPGIYELPAISEKSAIDKAANIGETLSIDEVLGYIASVERESDHPLARAILEKIGEVTHSPVESTEVVKGGGIVATVNGHRIAIGNAALMERENVEIGEKAKADLARFEKKGNSLVLSAVDGKLRVLMGIRDQVRPGVKEDLQRLKKLGVKNLVMLSGDNQGTVDIVGRELGLTEAHGNMSPVDKSVYIKKLIERGQTVAFVGDGVNDSPSLALANIGIAMGGGTDVAIETSDVVLMNSDFSRLPHALGLAKATAGNMKQNISIAVGVVLFLLAALVFSEWMNMSIGMLVHESSILVVIMNGMRLLRYKLKLK
ncbi:MAG: HAD-IC family P-type ATPase [Clostridiaceae bacterium]|nr:HAD-IC family P-type ATPase [Clostridiaceae bacterium]